MPARRAGTLVRNPATGEMVKGAAKPARHARKDPRLVEIEDGGLGLIRDSGGQRTRAIASPERLALPERTLTLPSLKQIANWRPSS